MAGEALADGSQDAGQVAESKHAARHHNKAVRHAVKKHHKARHIAKRHHINNDTASVQTDTNNISREARLMTDEARMYRKVGKEFAQHGRTLHGAKQFVDYEDRTIHTNTVEGAFSIFKRGSCT